MKQTTVQWLVNEVNLLENNGWILPLIEQAKEMEKQQIIDAIAESNKSNNRNVSLNPEQYYNETFKK